MEQVASEATHEINDNGEARVPVSQAHDKSPGLAPGAFVFAVRLIVDQGAMCTACISFSVK